MGPSVGHRARDRGVACAGCFEEPVEHVITDADRDLLRDPVDAWPNSYGARDGPYRWRDHDDVTSAGRSGSTESERSGQPEPSTRSQLRICGWLPSALAG